jgi:hypothetical protein
MSTLAFTACGSARFQTLQLSDHTLLPAARISKSLYRADRGLAPSDVQTELGIEGGVFGGSGEGSPFVFAETRIGNQTFPPPQIIETEFDFVAWDVSLHWRHALLNRRFGYDLFSGFGWADLDIEASSPAQHAKDSISSPALRLGGGAFFRVFSGTSLEAAGTVLGGNHNFTGMNGYRLSLVQKLGRHVTINGGYSSWNVESSNDTRSRIDLHLYGPAAGVHVKF